VLAHSNSVSTLYGHMSRFARKIHVGSHVNQGDVIGYVGMTGLATGPHLHYEYLMNGVHMNPQTVRLPGAEPLRTASLSKFHSAAAPLLSSLSGPPVATAPVAATLPAARAAPPAATAAPPAAATAPAATATADAPATPASLRASQSWGDSRSKTSVN